MVQICQTVEGIPLAIELAAVWVGMLSCQEIAQEINSNMDFLRTSMRDIPERHRSIRATFDHSWNLLSEGERRALCQLSVFHGGFDRMRQIAGDLPCRIFDAWSLVRRTEAGAMICIGDPPIYYPSRRACALLRRTNAAYTGVPGIVKNL
jgi:hypothetical protein